MKMSLYEYAVLLHPKSDKKGEPVGKSSILKAPTYILAKDDKQVGILAAREIPKEHIDNLERVEIVVRPF